LTEIKKKHFYNLSTILKQIVIKYWNYYAVRKGMKMPDGVLMFINNSDRYDFTNSCKRILWNKYDEVVELYIHPATHVDSVFFGNITEGRIKEYLLFSTKQIISCLQENQIQLVNFEIL